MIVQGRGSVPGEPAQLARVTLRPNGRAEMAGTGFTGEFPKGDPQRAGLKRDLTFHVAGEKGSRPLPTGLAVDVTL